MLYPYMTIIKDGTEIVYSDLMNNNGHNCVKVMFERWNKKRNSFDSMDCILPDGNMSHIIGYTKEEAIFHQKRIKKLAKDIIDCAKMVNSNA